MSLCKLHLSHALPLHLSMTLQPGIVSSSLTPFFPINYSHVAFLDVDTMPLPAVFLNSPLLHINIHFFSTFYSSFKFKKSLSLSISLCLRLQAMAVSSIYHFATLLLFCFITPLFSALVQEQPLVLKYHNGVLLKGNVTVNLIWYGQFTPTQRSIIIDFVNSLSSRRAPVPSAASWWQTTESYRGGGKINLRVGRQILHDKYTLGKILKNSHLLALASKTNFAIDSINVVLTAKDVAVDGFCMRCGSHGSSRGSAKGTYIWVGNSETQCPGQCAWPFHQPIYGPQTPPLVAPNGDVGVDGMIINLATLLANTVTNPFNSGYFQGPPTAPLEAVSACTGKFGAGSYPGYPGRVLVDKATGASFNSHGANGRKYLLPAMWDPRTNACKTLV